MEQITTKIILECCLNRTVCIYIFGVFSISLHKGCDVIDIICGNGKLLCLWVTEFSSTENIVSHCNREHKMYLEQPRNRGGGGRGGAKKVEEKSRGGGARKENKGRGQRKELWSWHLRIFLSW